MSKKNKTELKAGKDFIGIGVGAIIVNDENEILMMKRAASVDKDRTTTGMWSVAGGQVEFGESAEDAIKREIEEELCVEVEITKFIGYTDQILKESGVHWLCLHFLCKIKDGKPHITEHGKTEKLEWFAVTDLPINVGIAHVIRPLYLLGWITKEEYEKRLRTTPES
jgi:mutator protein MutT